MNRVVALAAILLLSASLGQAQQPTLINGAGATFPNPIYTKWFDEYIVCIRRFKSTISPLDRAAESVRSRKAQWTSARPTVR